MGEMLDMDDLVAIDPDTAEAYRRALSGAVSPEVVGFGVAHWNYRVVCESFDNPEYDDEYGIYEMYYDTDNIITGWSEHPARVMGDSTEELQETLELMLSALKQPVMPMKELPGV